MADMLTGYCINVAVSLYSFNIIHIGWLLKANMEITLEWVQTAILTTISNLLYVFALQVYRHVMYLFLK